MTNTEKIKTLLTPMLMDIYTTDDEITNLVNMVYDELAIECKPVKKLYQVTMFENENTYDLETLAQLHEKYEQGVSLGTIEAPFATDLDVMNMMKTLNIPEMKPTIKWETENLNIDLQIVSVDDIITEDGVSVMDKFTLLFGHTYVVHDRAFLTEFNDVSLYYVASVHMPLDDMHPSIFSSFVSPIVHGVKFYMYNTPQTRDLDQGNNLMAMRYFKAKEILIDQYPQKINFRNRSPRWL